MHVLDPFDFRIRLAAHVVERTGRIPRTVVLPIRVERRREPGQRLDRGAGAGMLVVVEGDAPVGAVHGHETAVEAALGLGLGCPFLAADREAVDGLARETLDRRDQVGGDALRARAGTARGAARCAR